MIRNLEWTQDRKTGVWEAMSPTHIDGDHFTWWIRPPRGARVWFQLDGSPELMDAVANTRFETLERAKAEAQAVDDRLFKEDDL